MTDQETNVSNAFATTLTAGMGATDLTATVASTSGISSPCYLVIDPDNEAKLEVILFDGTFTATEFVTTNLSNRYLDGSAAGSGIVHDLGALVVSVPLAQLWTDINDRVDAAIASIVSDHGALTGLADDDHTQYLRKSGGTMTGALTLSGAPTLNLHAATKLYVDTVLGTGVPSGIVTMWNGSIASIPTGWLHCNGANGTSDLRDRFIVGAGNSFAVDTTGGSNSSHSHSGPSHTHDFNATTSTVSNHSHAISSAGSHDHSGRTGGDAEDFVTRTSGGLTVVSNTHTHSISSGGAHDHLGTTSTSGGHSHTVAGTSVSGGTGATGNASHLPLHHAKAYIMKA